MKWKNWKTTRRQWLKAWSSNTKTILRTKIKGLKKTKGIDNRERAIKKKGEDIKEN